MKYDFTSDQIRSLLPLVSAEESRYSHRPLWTHVFAWGKKFWVLAVDIHFVQSQLFLVAVEIIEVAAKVELKSDNSMPNLSTMRHYWGATFRTQNF